MKGGQKPEESAESHQVTGSVTHYQVPPKRLIWNQGFGGLSPQRRTPVSEHLEFQRRLQRRNLGWDHRYAFGFGSQALLRRIVRGSSCIAAITAEAAEANAKPE